MGPVSPPAMGPSLRAMGRPVMSRFDFLDIDMDSRPQTPQLLLLESKRRERPQYYDSSGPLFSLYSEIAKEEDHETTEGWKQDATDGILVFTGLFSAAVAALLTVSVQDIRPSPQDKSEFYLANIYQIFADPNVTVPRTSGASTLAIPPPFSAPRYAMWVNSLWFLSLVISLSCALLAISLRQWARRYIGLTRPTRCKPEKRARRREFFHRGVDKMRVAWAVETLPAMLHLSLFLFFAGLVVFLFNNSHFVFGSVILWMGPFFVLYGWITLKPISQPESTYYGPLSSTAWLLHAYLRQVLFRVLTFITRRNPFSFGNPFRSLIWPYGYWMSDGVSVAADEATSTPDGSFDIDSGILYGTLGALGEDDRLEKFFEAIPGFFDSKQVDISPTTNTITDWAGLRDALKEFLHRTLSSNSIIEPVKIRRLNIYLKANNVISKPVEVSSALRDIINSGQLPQTIETANILAPWCTSEHEHIAMTARCAVASILRSLSTRDEHWIALARDNLKIPMDDLRDNIDRGDDSVLLVILIHMTRQINRTQNLDWEILSSLSKFDISQTFAGQQNEFCALWNDTVQKAKLQQEFDLDSNSVEVLRAIRHLYITIHHGTDAAPTAFDADATDAYTMLFDPSSYPTCNIETHRQNPTDPRPTQLGDHAAASPHSSRLETRRIPRGSTATQQAEDGIPSASLTTDPVHIPMQIALVTDSSIHESIQTVARDLIRLVSMEVSHLSPPSSLSSAGLLPTVVRSDPLPDSPPVTGNSSIAPQRMPQPQQQTESDAQPYPVSGITETLSTVNPIPNPNPTTEGTLRTTLHGGVILMVLPSSVESALVRRDPISTTARLPPPPGDSERD